MFCGGSGNISVTANVAPHAMHELCVAAMEGRIADAIAINNKLIPLHNKLFVEPNPVPVKWALQQMGKMKGGIRLPLVPLGSGSHDVIRHSLRDAGVL
jgi:4-hydroxy-tetrahydrodipicolinate synthase